ncbi:MAG TPA: A24 family peptidase [Stellaceae bacterium]|nr:A24 family peptidase [Stellaceae bacterium]
MSVSLPLWLLAALVAPCVGSFLATLVVRFPALGSALTGRSACPSCRHPLAALDLVPLASWLALRGRCRHCGAAISPIYPAVEAASLAVALWAAAIIDSAPALLLTCVLGWTLLALAVIDWRSYVLPDVLVLILVVGGGVASLVDDPARLPDHLIGAFGGFGVFALIALLYRRWRGRDGLGWGDAKLLGALGLWVTWTGLPSIVLLAAVSALLFAAGKRLLGERFAWTDPLPFGPFLALGGWMVWLYGPLMLS